MSYSVILPTFNESGHIIKLIKQINKILKRKTVYYEIIVVDDNSIDGTQHIVKKYLKKNIFLRLLIRNKKKRNLAQSINYGIKKSRFKYVIWMDADFQHPPKFINNLIKNSDKADTIICSRFLNGSKRYFMKKKNVKDINENQSIFFNKVCNFFLFKDIKDFTSGFVCLKKSIIKNYNLHGYYGDYFLNLICYLKKKNNSIVEIPFEDSKRATGQSKTIDNFNFKYIYICFRYFLSFIMNIFKKYLFK